MSALLKTLGVFGPVSALLLGALLLAAGASADDVTIKRCQPYRPTARVRLCPTDNDATKLYLTDCNYSNVNLNDLAGLISVEEIYYNRNNIVSIPPSIFRSVPGLKLIMLDGNKLRELPVFTEHSCPQLTVLYLADNLITGIWTAGIFTACTKLQRVYFDGNHIEYVHPDAFSSLNDLIELYLHRNKIQYITNQMFVNNPKLQLLALHQNRITNLPLDFARNFKRTGISLVYFYFFSNPMHCGCLLEVLADVKKAGVTYYKEYVHDPQITHYDGTRTECVYTGAAPCRPTLLRPPLCSVYG